MKSRVVLLVGVLTAAVMLGASPGMVRADTMKVIGGGVASFDNVFRLSSYFGVDATMQDNGDTQGQFTCVIVDFVVVIGNFTHGTMNSDGSVKLEGTAAAVLLPSGQLTDEFPYSVDFVAGGPGAGKFIYHDPLVEADHETVFLGTIQIKKP
jgi:hypothetical protein